MFSGVRETDASKSMSRKGLYLFTGLQHSYLHYTFHTNDSVYQSGMTNQCFKGGPINTCYKS